MSKSMAMLAEYHLEWSDLAFASKRSLRDLNAIFIAAPRELSLQRLKQLVQTYLPKANVVLGIAQEPYVAGLEERPQFRMLTMDVVASMVSKVNTATKKYQLYTLGYSQRDAVYIYEKIPFQQVILINGSWYHGFHNRPEYYTLIKNNLPFTKLSPFASEQEAKDYAANTTFAALPTTGLLQDQAMMQLAHQAATHSYDYAGLQTGGALGYKQGTGYNLLASAHNQIVPYETYAMHHGSERELYFSPPNDLNHYDTIHYEVALMLQLVEQGQKLHGLTLFETVLSCPHCSRMLAATDIAEIVYAEDHSNGYAVQLLSATGKKVRRLVL